MADVVYRKQCVVCERIFDLEAPEAPIPEHSRADYPALPCNGAGHTGKMLGQKLR